MHQTINKTTYNFNKLYRFKSPPPKIKLILYKTLIRPLMEYPSILIADTSKTHINKLQIIQNKALRFIQAYNTHWSDFITNNTLDNTAKLETVKERLNKLQLKSYQRALDTITDDQGRNVIYCAYILIIQHFQPARKLRDLYERVNLLDQLEVGNQFLSSSDIKLYDVLEGD